MLRIFEGLEGVNIYLMIAAYILAAIAGYLTFTSKPPRPSDAPLA
jgi:hypothetical protein